MADVSNIVGISFEVIATTRIDQLKAMMGSVIDAEVTVMAPILRALFVIFAGRQFFLVLLGHMTIERFFSSILRVAIVAFLIVHAGEFTQQVENPVFNTIPQAISSTVLGASGVATGSTESIAAQFDQVAAAADAVTALIVSRSTGWSVAGLVNYATAYIADGALQVILTCIVAIWLLGQTLLAIILCFGPLLLGFELFDRTRGWIDQWLGKLVGMTCFGLATSILLAIQMQGLKDLLQNAYTNLPTNGAQAVSILTHVCCNVVLDLLTMISLPLICSIGSGVAAALAAPSALAVGRTLAVGRGAARLATGAARTGSSSNSITRI